jgi:hypothetical protein
MLAKCVKGARHKWGRYLLEALFNTRIRTHTTTGFSPFYLLYGVQPHIPGDTTQPFVLNQDLVEIRARLLEDLGQDLAAAMERCSGSAAAAELRYDILVRRDPLEIGDSLLLRRCQKLKYGLGHFVLINW